MVVIGGLLALFAVMLAACGEPTYTYVKNSGEHTYFKVPRQWHQVDRAELVDPFSSADPDSQQKRIENLLFWSVGYDADPEPSGAHLFTATDQPFVYSSVRPRTTAQQGGTSLDSLRNLVYPVTILALPPTDVRSIAAAQAGYDVESFELLRDEVLSPAKGIRGVRVIFHYPFRGTLNTFDQTAYVNDDASRLYILLIRCSARCYSRRFSELDGIATSFTVRSGL